MSKIQRSALERGGTMHWLHWTVVFLSLVLTLGAWAYSKSQLEEKVAVKFEREVARATDLVLERMLKYEDALWGGVALTRTLGREVEYEEWETFAASLDLNTKYPGINGIGIISHVEPEALASFLERQRQTRPDFEVYPEHANGEYWPITFIEPVIGNQKAVGLDMAHESNRFTSAQRARDSGKAQITGPITLVQYAAGKPGFLFYAPFYSGGVYQKTESRQENFLGLVYAPFVVEKLMEGVLAKQNRHVGIRIVDGSERIYDELVPEEPDFDPDPLLTKRVDLDLYGRVWTFDAWASKSFRAASTSGQPTLILAGGLSIDLLLLTLFLLLSRANRRAISYADGMTAELVRKTESLQQSNRELEEFARVASHDLREPLRKVVAFGDRLETKFGQILGEQGCAYLRRMIDATTRMDVLIESLLAYSRVMRTGDPFRLTDLNRVAGDVASDLEEAINAKGAVVEIGRLPQIEADPVQMRQLFQNLISNAVKFSHEGTPPEVTVRAESVNGSACRIQVSDNGIGFDPKYQEQIFQAFQRLHGVGQFEGAGIGLSICRKIVERHEGTIEVASTPGVGSVFTITLPLRGADGGTDALAPVDLGGDE